MVRAPAHSMPPSFLIPLVVITQTSSKAVFLGPRDPLPPVANAVAHSHSHGRRRWYALILDESLVSVMLVWTSRVPRPWKYEPLTKFLAEHDTHVCLSLLAWIQMCQWNNHLHFSPLVSSRIQPVQNHLDRL